MLRELTKAALLGCSLLVLPFANSQALPTATGRGSLQVGGGWTYAHPDYGQKSIQGATIFADLNLTHHISGEAEFHYIALSTPTDLGENSFLVGPRFMYNRGRYTLYGKGLIGIGDIDIQEIQDNPQGGAGKYLAVGLGGGIDVRATSHLVIRPIDFEYQHWNYQSGLTPLAITFGVAYRFN
jgi:hypothetical protein